MSPASPPAPEKLTALVEASTGLHILAAICRQEFPADFPLSLKFTGDGAVIETTTTETAENAERLAEALTTQAAESAATIAAQEKRIGDLKAQMQRIADGEYPVHTPPVRSGARDSDWAEHYMLGREHLMAIAETAMADP